MRGNVGGTAVVDRGGTTQPTDDGRDPDLPRLEGTGPARPPRWSPLRLPLLILFVGSLITALLT